MSGIAYLAAALVLAGALWACYPLLERFFVYYPTGPLEETPEGWPVAYKEVHFETEDGIRLHGWFFPLDGEGPVILFCHGNAGNISHRLENVRLLLERKLRVFIFDYRGYGKSGGSPSEKGLYRDGLAAYDYLATRERIAPDKIVAFGRSLGASVAIEIALHRAVGSVILESGFTSTRDMAKTMFLFCLFSPLLPAHFNNLEKIPKVAAPTLIIHGEFDEIVPFSMGKKLFKAAREPKSFYPLPGAGHNDTYLAGGEAYFKTFASFARSPAGER